MMVVASVLYIWNSNSNSIIHAIGTVIEIIITEVYLVWFEVVIMSIIIVIRISSNV